MRSLFILVWCGVILMFTCTVSFHDLIHFGVVQFQWDVNPPYLEFFLPFPSDVSRDLFLQKLGHILAFQFLTILLLMKYKSKFLILLTASSFAALTEFLQLYFHRGGRVFDIGFDLIGILVPLALASIFTISQSSRMSVKS
ncbi:VanZ family protein [Bacillus sp. EB106-08-02-XG196]|uniref:VanZ family protein n=1 Tax=Bacillus sp. EB106-08-02-XG196 TaxID=2737049 RepID=UPI0015C4DD1B|nr:VanZ family protein [Bacillus sp. EB106-08-02-XG196]NWQ39559.1 VanZ family protein [Bacillus sp. EB106-08-02-XG196]